jgi:hypothetical protein
VLCSGGVVVVCKEFRKPVQEVGCIAQVKHLLNQVLACHTVLCVTGCCCNMHRRLAADCW